MNQKDIIDIVAEKTGYPKYYVRDIVTKTFDVILEEMFIHPVTIRGFGKFFTKERKGRYVIHPETGEKIIYPSKLKPILTLSRSLPDEEF